jgi:hypothetical protein
MSTQSYYKDRLGFDPREALYDGPVKGSRGHSQTSHYTASNGNDNYATPPKKHKQQHQNQQHHASFQQQHESTPQGGYEDALTQFKGSMSLWEFFVENSDKLGMSDGVLGEKNTNRCIVCAYLSKTKKKYTDESLPRWWPLMALARKLYTGLERFSLC